MTSTQTVAIFCIVGCRKQIIQTIIKIDDQQKIVLGGLD
jgi:hypothetical protein